MVGCFPQGFWRRTLFFDILEAPWLEVTDLTLALPLSLPQAQITSRQHAWYRGVSPGIFAGSTALRSLSSS